MFKSYFFSLRYKLMVAFLAISFFISIALGYVSYSMLKKRMFEEFLYNVKTMTQLSTQILNRDALKTIIDQTKKPLSNKQINAIQHSKEMILLAKQLDFIRSTSNLVQYIYLIIPTRDPNVAKQIVDADFLYPTSKTLDFYADFNISSWPVMQQAFREKAFLIEKQFTYDDIYHTYTISGYAPIFAKNGQTFLALLAIDMTNEDAQKALKVVTQQSILVAGIALLISFFTAVILGVAMTRGIIRLDKLVRQFAKNDFNARSDLRSHDEIGRLGYSFNYMADTIQQILAASNRFVPYDLLKLLKKESIVDVNLGDHILSEMTILFADVRNFTVISEKMSVRDNFDFINSYLKHLGPVIRNNKGIIDKYLGDGIMALFSGQVDDALNAALSMHRVLEKYNKSKDSMRYHTVHLGIGIHSGSVMLGTVGEEQRMDGTVISDTVNLASRIEGLTKYYNALVIISNKVVEQLTQKDAYFIRYLDKIRVVGKMEPVCIYEVCDAEDKEIIALKKATLQDYNQALDYFYSRRFKEAARLFAQIMKANPNDKPAQMFYERAHHFTTHEPPSDWDGVIIYDKK